MSTVAAAPKQPKAAVWIAATLVSVVLWFVLYGELAPLSTWTVSLLPLAQDSRLAQAATFFIFETPKVLMLLTLVVFAMGVVRSFFSPERTRKLLAGKHEGIGNIAAAGLGSRRSAPARRCRCSSASFRPECRSG